jgi:ribose 5-phosphate isomerase B
MKIAIGSDHRGLKTAEHIAETLAAQGIEVTRMGSCTNQPCDYPESAYQVGTAISRGEFDRGILICGTGIGMSIAANKIPGIRAAVVHDELTAQLSRTHNDTNVLCLSADLLGERLIDKIVDIWLKSAFEGGRHARRVAKIEMIEQQLDPAEAPAG